MSSAAAVTLSCGTMTAGTIVINKKSNRQKIKLRLDITFEDIFLLLFYFVWLLCLGQFSGCSIDRILLGFTRLFQKAGCSKNVFQHRVVIDHPYAARGACKRLMQPL